MLLDLEFIIAAIFLISHSGNGLADGLPPRINILLYNSLICGSQRRLLDILAISIILDRINILVRPLDYLVLLEVCIEFNRAILGIDIIDSIDTHTAVKVFSIVNVNRLVVILLRIPLVLVVWLTIFEALGAGLEGHQAFLRLAADLEG